MANPTVTDDTPEPERPQQAPLASPSAPSRRTGGRVAMIVVGSLVALVALGVIACGAYGLWLDAQRSNGYVMTSSERFATGGYALSASSLDVSSDVPGFLYGRSWLGDVRIRGHSANRTRPLFIGIARTDQVDRYLAGVAHSEVVNISANPFGSSYKPTYRFRPGAKPATPPDRAGFWVAHVAGQGRQTLTWSVKQGSWAVVVMRPDGSRAVTADLAAGAQLPALLWVSIGVIVFGLLLGGGAAALIYFGAREPKAPAVPA